jgi:hypothetical protein
VGRGKVFVLEDPGDRVELGQVKEAPGLDQLRNYHGPAPDVREPVERPEAGVDNVEVAPT